MEVIKQLIEWYFGIPAAVPGQGTAWRLTTEPAIPDWIAPWAAMLCCLALAGYVVGIYLRDAKALSLPKRLALIALRMTVVALLLVILTELTVSVERTGLPFVAVLIDDSASMGLEDQYSSGKLKSAASMLLNDIQTERSSRLNLAKAILTRNQGAFFKRLARRHKLRVYRFSDDCLLVGHNEYVRHAEIDRLLPQIENLSANGRQTRPGPAVRTVFDDFRGTPPSAIIILTDGITTTSDSDKLSSIVDVARKELVPIFTVGIGSGEPARDLRLYDTLVDEVAFVEDPISFSSKLKAYGYPGQQVRVSLKEESSSEVLMSEVVQIGDVDGQVIPFELIYTPPVKGDFNYLLEVSPRSNESNIENNSESRQVSVREGKIRVLLVDLYPRWEFRELKFLLERERTIELHTVLQDADLEFADQDKSAQALKGRFPVKREQLFTYDVVIFGDVSPTFLSSGILTNLHDFVDKGAGGLVMIAGEDHNPLAYGGTPLESLLPIELEGARLPDTQGTSILPFSPRLTLEGQKGTMVFRFDEDESKSLEIWQNLPGLHWMLEAPQVKPGTTVFVEHPSQMGVDGKLPLIALRRFGAGKVLFHATDESWRWRFRTEDKYYGRYWIQAIRYLSRSRLLGQVRAAELTSDRSFYERGETISLRVRFLEERLMPNEADGVTVIVERRGDVQRPVVLTQLPHAPTVFEGQLRHTIEGVYHAWVSQPAFRDAPPAIDFRVEAPQRELQKRSLDLSQLMQTAKATRGKHYTIATAGRIAADIPLGFPVTLEAEDPILLWNRPEVLILFTLLLLTEWVMRKRARLI